MKIPLLPDKVGKKERDKGHDRHEKREGVGGINEESCVSNHCKLNMRKETVEGPT